LTRPRATAAKPPSTDGAARPSRGCRQADAPERHCITLSVAVSQVFGERLDVPQCQDPFTGHRLSDLRIGALKHFAWIAASPIREFEPIADTGGFGDI
jgi:hypothetical protein